MKRAVESLGVVPTEVLIDGLHCPSLPMAMRAIVQGDSKEATISAASILAKTARDGFAKHKGYPTSLHIQVLEQHGVLSIHRKSYAPVKKILNLK